jgi:hypothetical protein
MASGGKRKTTMAKLARESRLRERRQEKQAKREARKLAAAHDPDQRSDRPYSKPLAAHEPGKKDAGPPAHDARNEPSADTANA